MRQYRRKGDVEKRDSKVKAKKVRRKPRNFHVLKSLKKGLKRREYQTLRINFSTKHWINFGHDNTCLIGVTGMKAQLEFS